MQSKSDQLKHLYKAALHGGSQEMMSQEQPPVLEGYDVQHCLGRGGMGVVYLARNTRLDRYEALKVLHGSADSLEAERLTREGRVLARLNHPHIVGVYDCLLDDQQRPCLILEYVEGGDLAERISSGGLTITDALACFVEIVSAVGYAHEQGILHRDLKPSNIFFEGAGRIKVGDFGLAMLNEKESVTTLTLSGTTIGTEAYMSPEQKSAAPVDARSDIYSLGVILYELITGRRPQGVFASLSDPNLDRVVRRCLQEDPQDRYENCEALLADFNKMQPKNNTPLPWVLAVTVILAIALIAVWVFLPPATGEHASSDQASDVRTPTGASSAESTESVGSDAAAPTAGLDPEFSMTNGIDLLPRLRDRFETTRRRGIWMFAGDSLVTEQASQSQAWIELPYDPGTSYDLEVEATRLTGQDSLPIIFPTAAGVVSFELDAWRAGIGGFQNVDGQDLRQSNFSFPYRYRNGEPTTVRLSVRPDQVAVWVDGRLLQSLDLTNRQLSPPPTWEVPSDFRFGIGAWESGARFDRLIVSPVEEVE